MLNITYRRHPIRPDAPALSPAGVSQALAMATALIPGAEVIVTSSDAGTECVLVATPSASLRRWTSLLPATSKQSDGGVLELRDRDAIAEVVSTAAGLRDIGSAPWSRFSGGAAMAHDAGTLGPVLSKLVDVASDAGIRARAETLAGIGVDDDGYPLVAASARDARSLAWAVSRPHVRRIVEELTDEFAAWLAADGFGTIADGLTEEAELVTREAAGTLGEDRPDRDLHRAVRRLVHDHLADPLIVGDEPGDPGKDPST